ncbi:MAG: hypothetical protein RDV41_08905, partial [Planctomycetota bacterium]|nr:hypothetical protein [Planctomycetota bacterium]
TLERLKTHVNKWLFGAPHAADSNIQSLSPQILERLDDAVRSAIRFPELGVPRSVLSTSQAAAPRVDQPSAFGFRVVQVPGATPPAGLISMLNPFLAAPGKTYPSLSLQPIPMHKDKWAAVRAQVGSLAKQLAALRAVGVDCVFVSPMQNEVVGLVDEYGHPTAAFYAMLVMNRILGGKTYDARPVFGREVAHMVFHGATESAVLFWQAEGSGASPLRVPVSLDGDVRVLQLDGSELKLSEDGGTRYAEVSDVPCVLLGVQSSFLQMQLSTVFAPLTINCAEGRQRVQLEVTNTFTGSTVETLDIRIMFPPEWSVTRTMRTVVQLAPGNTATLVTEIAMPLRETLGDKEIEIDLCAYVRGAKYVGRVVRKLTVASEIDTALEFDKDPAGNVTALSIRVDNIGERHIDAKVYVQIPGMPEREIAVRSLAPRSFRVAKVPVSSQADPQGEVTVHLVEEGGRRLFLNDRIRLP